MRKLVFLFVAFLITSLSLTAKDAYHISVEIDGFQEGEVYLGYYLLDKQYILDTALVSEDGKFVFSGDEELPGGIYLIVLPPDNVFFQVMVSPGEQHFSIKVSNPTTPSDGVKFKGSQDNTLFYDYLDYLGKKRPLADQLRKEMEATQIDDEKAKTQMQLDELNKEVNDHQQNLIKKHSNTLTARIIKANLPMDMPEFSGTEDEVRMAQWRYTKKHYFDQIDLTDPRMLRTPFLFQRVDHYIEKLTVQHPDSISESLHFILEKIKPAPETFKHYLVHYLNKYAGSKIVGFDAIYVFLAENYYATGQAPWTDEEQLNKIVDNANRLKPLLIGKIAPNIKMQTQQKKEIWLHDFESPYTVLFFWDPDCGHCKKSMPDMLEFYKQFRERGVEVFAVCTKLYNELESCWEFIEEKEMGIWLNAVDPYHRSKYKTIYDIRSTPQVYILDHKKEILSKRIGAEQLPEVMEKILEMNGEKKP